MNIAFMFSGQGSQYVGMCQELYNEYEVVKHIFSQATRILGYDVKEIMFHQEEKLNDTLYTQPLMFVMYVSILEVLKEKKITSTHTLGLSLGEFGALYDADVFDFETGLKLLSKRGLLMKETCVKTNGKMSAILGMEVDPLLQLLDSIDGKVTIANYNTYGQLVISGEEKAVLEANSLALEQGAKRAILLNTSGPFHTDLMKEASELFKRYIADLELTEPTKKLLLNVTGDYYQDNLKRNMAKQITSSVMFYQMIEKVLKDNTKIFIEIGPKRSLCSFVKKVNSQVTILNVEDTSSLEKTLAKLEELL